MKAKLIFLGILLFISTSIFAQSSVWKVEGQGNTIYVGGTVHMLKASDYPLPVEFDSAFVNSDKIVFEVDMAEMESADLQNQIMARAMYSDSTTLSDVLSKETYAMLETELAKHNIPIAGVAKMKPSMVSILLAGMQMQSTGMSEIGVDKYYYQKGVEEKKSFDYLETIDSQLEILLSMGEGIEDEFIKYSLDNMEESMGELDLIIEDWRSGKLKYTTKALKEMKSEFPEITKSLLEDRNLNWMPALDAYLTTEEVEFVLFGNMHLAGDEGILKLLMEKGYTVKKLKL